NGPLQGSPCASALVQAGNWKVSSEPVQCLTLPLPKTWDEYLRSLDPRFRTKLRSALTSLQEHVKFEPVQCVSVEQVEEWLPILFDLHTRRWATRNKPGVFRDRTKQSFYRDFSRAALEQGWLAFHQLAWGERPLALQYGMVYRNRFHLLQEGYDPDF